MKLHVLEGRQNTMLALVNNGELFTWGNGQSPERIYKEGSAFFTSTSTNGLTHAAVDIDGMIHLWGEPFFVGALSKMELAIPDKKVVGVKLFDTFMIVSTENEIHVIESFHRFDDVVAPGVYRIHEKDIQFSYDLSTKPGVEKDTGQAEVFVTGDRFFAIMSVSTTDHTVKVYVYGGYDNKYYDKLTDILPEMSEKDFVAGKESVLQIGVSNNTLYALTTDGILFLKNTITAFHANKHPLAFKDMGAWTLCKPVFSDNSTLATGTVLINTRGIYFNQVDGGLFYLGYDSPIADPMEGDDEDLQVMNYREVSFEDGEKHDWKYYKLYKLNHEPVTDLVGNVAGSLVAVRDTVFDNIHTWGSRGNKLRKQYKLQIHEFTSMMYTGLMAVGDTIFATDMNGDLYSMGMNSPKHILGYVTDMEEDTTSFRKVEFDKLETNGMDDTLHKLQHPDRKEGKEEKAFDTDLLESVQKCTENAFVEGMKDLTKDMPKGVSQALIFIDDNTDFIMLENTIRIKLTNGFTVGKEVIENFLKHQGASEYVFDLRTMAQDMSDKDKVSVDKLVFINRYGKETTPKDVTDHYHKAEGDADFTYLILNPVPVAFGNTLQDAVDSIDEIQKYLDGTMYVCVDASIQRVDGKESHYVPEEESDEVHIKQAVTKVTMASTYGKVGDDLMKKEEVNREDLKIQMSSLYGEFGKQGNLRNDLMNDTIKKVSDSGERIAVAIIEDSTGIETLHMQIGSMTGAENILLAIRNMVDENKGHVVFNGDGKDEHVDKFYLFNFTGEMSPRPHSIISRLESVLELDPSVVIVFLTQLPEGFGNLDFEIENNFQLVKDFTNKYNMVLVTGFQQKGISFEEAVDPNVMYPIDHEKVDDISVVSDRILLSEAKTPVQGVLVINSEKGSEGQPKLNINEDESVTVSPNVVQVKYNNPNE